MNYQEFFEDLPLINGSYNLRGVLHAHYSSENLNRVVTTLEKMYFSMVQKEINQQLVQYPEDEIAGYHYYYPRYKVCLNDGSVDVAVITPHGMISVIEVVKVSCTQNFKGVFAGA